jgi:hypothetical protein
VYQHGSGVGNNINRSKTGMPSTELQKQRIHQQPLGQGMLAKTGTHKESPMRGVFF